MDGLTAFERERLAKMKAAIGPYYQRDAALSDRATGDPFPWQGKTCKDCPFWVKGVYSPNGFGSCRVHNENRQGYAHTCIYFDPANHDEAQRIMANRLRDDAPRNHHPD